MPLSDEAVLILQVFFALIGVWFAVSVLRKRIRITITKKLLNSKIKEKNTVRQNQLVNLENILSLDGELLNDERRHVLNLRIVELLYDLKQGVLKATDVLKAYQAKAIEATKKCNCITEFFIEAEEWATFLDTSAVKFPLHGLPFSVKENFNVRGHDTTNGLAKFVDNPQDSDAVLVTALKKLGAIPFCKTNVPQTLMSFGCDNPVFGQTVHPTHSDRTCGGSSGGEGVLIALGGSPFGIGSDIGGSSRIPAHFCGIPAIKPTAKRLSYAGTRSSSPLLQSILLNCSSGLFAKDVTTLTIIMKALASSQYMSEMDPSVVPIPWRRDLYESKSPLRIGYVKSDAFFPTTSSIQRAVEITKSALVKQGHELVPIEIPRLEDSFKISSNIIMADGGAHFLKKWDCEKISPLVSKQRMTCSLPLALRRAAVPFLKLVSRRTAEVFSAGCAVSRTADFIDLVQKKADIVDDVLRVWHDAQIDALIYPGFAFPAIPQEYISYLFPATAYTILFNLLDFPAASVPVTRETANDQNNLDNYHGVDKDRIFTYVRKALAGGLDLPVGVQVVALPWKEEIVLRVLNEIEKEVQFN